MRIIVDVAIAFIIIYFSGLFLIYFLDSFSIFFPNGFSNLLGASVTVGLATLYLFYKYPVSKTELIRNIKHRKDLALWGGIGGVVLGGLNFPYSFFMSKESLSPDQLAIFEQSLFFIILSLAFACTVIPLIEELFFRALIYQNIKNRFGIFCGYAASSILFSIGHGLSLTSIINSFVLCYIYEKTNLIGACIVAHSLWNLIWYIILYGVWGSFV